MRCSADQIRAVDDFCSIYKATIFSAEQMILGIEASRFVESLRLEDKLFPFLTSSNSIFTCRNLTSFGTFVVRYLDLCTKCMSVSLANNMLCFRSTIRELRSKTYEEKG